MGSRGFRSNAGRQYFGLRHNGPIFVQYNIGGDMNSATPADINAAVSARKLKTRRADFNDKKPATTSQDVDTVPLIGKVIDLTGKKLKNDLTVVRKGTAITLKKGMVFDDIPAEYKNGPGKIMFKASHFE